MRATWRVASVAICSAILVSACATVDFKKVEVTQVTVTLSAGGNKDVHSIIPGDSYDLRVSALLADGKVVNSIDRSQLEVTSEDNSFTVSKPFLGIALTASRNTLALAAGKGYQVSIGIAGNPFPAQHFSFPVSWDDFNRLEFAGTPGSNGSEGFAGQSGSYGSSTSTNGTDGGRGGVGGIGGPGPELRFLVMYYDVSGLDGASSAGPRMLLLCNLASKELFLAPAKRFVIDSVGGPGGHGGRGGRGGSAGQYSETSNGLTTTKYGRSGRDGDGGTGGRGGDGGKLTIVYCTDSIREFIVPTASGGKGGSGGDGGFSGTRGPDGTAGSVAWEKMSYDGAMALLKSQQDTALDTARVRAD